jgi:uncharacterized membrane protein
MDNRTVGIGLGVVMFLTGLLMHILSYTKQIPPEKKKQVAFSALALMIIGAMMAMWPWMMRIVQKGPPY